MTFHEGYRVTVFRDRANGLRLPMLTIAASADRVFDLFLALVEPLGDVVQVILESSHGRDCDRHDDYRRSRIDTPVFLSHCCDMEDLLVNDGCTGIAVMHPSQPVEIQFDEHKLLSVYAPDVTRYRRILRDHGIPRIRDLHVIAEAEHLHFSTEDYADQFQQFAMRLGVVECSHVLSDEF